MRMSMKQLKRQAIEWKDAKNTEAMQELVAIIEDLR